MNDLKLQKFISQKAHLMWYIDEIEKVSKSSIVESFLNYGSWDDIQELIKIMGKEDISIIFKKQLENKRINYSNKTKNFFSLYFNNNA